MTSILLTFAVPHTRVFYFFVQKEGHHLAASLLISLCLEHFICPVCDNCTALVVCPYMRIFPLLNRSDVFLAPLTRHQKKTMFTKVKPRYTCRCCIADLPPCRLSPEGLQHCRPSLGRSATLPGRSATLQTFPEGGRFAILQIFPLSLQFFPRGRSATLQTFPHFCKVPDFHQQKCQKDKVTTQTTPQKVSPLNHNFPYRRISTVVKENDF